MMEALICLPIAVILLIMFIEGIRGVKIVPEYQRLVVFRLGRVLPNPRGPGIVFLIPFLDRAVKVDLREQPRESKNNKATTKDFRTLLFSFRYFFRVIDPAEVAMWMAGKQTNLFESTMVDMATVKFRQLISDVNSADLSSEIKRLEQENVIEMNLGAKRLGMQVTNLEITEITPVSQ